MKKKGKDKGKKDKRVRAVGRERALSYAAASRLLQRSSCWELIGNRKGVERTASDQNEISRGLRAAGRNDHRPFWPKKLVFVTPTESVSERVRGLQPSASVIPRLSQKRILLEFLTRKFFGQKGR